MLLGQNATAASASESDTAAPDTPRSPLLNPSNSSSVVCPVRRRSSNAMSPSAARSKSPSHTKKKNSKASIMPSATRASKAPSNLDFPWPFPEPYDASSLWYRMKTKFFSGFGYGCARIILRHFNQMEVHNRESFMNHFRANHAFITVANHWSCYDDTGIWGMIAFNEMKLSRWRFIPTAADICFTTKITQMGFSAGRGVPIVRGDGVYQKGMEFCLDQLDRDQWVHIYPEGKVNLNRSPFGRLKWGVGRLMSESKACPPILPIWHIGMDEVLPNVEHLSERQTYRPRCGKKVTIVVGEEIAYKDILMDMRQKEASETEIRKVLTDLVQDAMAALEQKAMELHNARG